MKEGYYGPDQLAQVKAKVNIVDLVGEYTPLRKAGNNYVGCCCFHQERTPSMNVYPEEGRWHCFGCGVKGDALDLVQGKERCDFREALELLARRVGVTLVSQNSAKGGPTKAEREQLLAAMEFTAAFHQAQLWSGPGDAAVAYLHGRGFTDDTLRRYRIGWAPGRGALVTAARKAGHDIKHLIVTGNATDKDGQIRDRFYDRIMFPICDRFAQPIAFSARIMPDDERRLKEAGTGCAKYMNTPDTVLYHKGSVVWNLQHARAALRDIHADNLKNKTNARPIELLVMEGPTDVMAADQAGERHCCACMGTAITGEHFRQLGQAVGEDGRVVLVLDTDAAGKAGAHKAVATALAAGVLVHVAQLPAGKDPSELFASAGAA